MYIVKNRGNLNLENRLNQIIPLANEIKILVDFFYFSGLDAIYESLKNNKDLTLKILVGLDVDKGSYSLYEYGENKRISIDERIDRFVDSIKNVFNFDEFDTQDFYEKSKFFLKMIEEDRLIIRKTREPNHAKLYILKLRDNQIIRDELFITGSSNLTKSGLSKQNEFNIEISDFGLEEVNKYFDGLWERAIKLTEDKNTKQKIIKVIRNETPLKEITPYQAYVLSLKTYIDSFHTEKPLKRLEKLLERKGYRRFSYQIDAVNQAVSIIEENNGVIIADVVGLGKSIIASSIGYVLGKKGIIISPPGLVENWERYIEDFELYKLDWKVYSVGKLEKVLKEINEDPDIEVVIIDEAHRFRNEDTKSYDLLSKIVRGKQVILLTATPFNNRPSDIFSLLKLFQPPKKSTITLEENALIRFKRYEKEFKNLVYIKKYYKSADPAKRKKALGLFKELFNHKDINIKEIDKRIKTLAKEIKRFIQPVVIRRNRLDLMKNPLYKEEIKKLPKLEDPIEKFYELTKEQSKFYDKVLNDYFSKDNGRFKGAIYVPYIYEKGITLEEVEEEKEGFEFYQQENLRDFMRRLLVRRFESSFGSFKQSIENFLNIYKKAKMFIERTGYYVLDRKFIEESFNLDDDEILEELQKRTEILKSSANIEKEKRNIGREYYIYDINNFKKKEKFLKDIESDIKLFEKILKEIDRLNLVKNDPKAKELINLIKDTLSKEKKPKRKVIVFSEFRDTVRYLKPILEQEFNVLTVDGHLSSSKIEQIKRNFDASYKYQEDEYDVLLTTDKISEGFNLARAGIIVNYDIPWNPVRVIQRVGRINRIGQKVFDKLYVVNFFPTEKGESLTKQREIAENKLFLIHNSIGEDAKIFSPDEEPTPSELYQRLSKNPDEIEEESFFTKAIKEFQKIKEDNPQIISQIEKLPNRIKVSKKGNENELILLIKKGKNLFVNYKSYSEDQPLTVSFEEIYEKIKATPEEKPLEKSEKFWEVYEQLKSYEKNKQYKPTANDPEVKARNMLKSLLSKPEIQNNEKVYTFIKNLIKDIEDYGTIPVYTLKEISDLNQNKIDECIDFFNKLMEELGGADFIQKYKIKKQEKEVLIAIENISE